MSQTNKNKLKQIFQLVDRLEDSYVKDSILRLKKSWEDEEKLTRKKKTKYCLRNKQTGEYLRIDQYENPEDNCCGEYTWQLTKFEQNKIWWTKSPLHAIQTLYAPQQWYNSSYENPTHSYNPNDYEVVSNKGTVINIKPISRYVYGKMYDYTHSKPKTKCRFYAEQFKTKKSIEQGKKEYLCWSSMKYHIKWFAHLLD